MVRIARKASAFATLAFVFLCAQLTGIAQAELLQRLHVLDFKVTSDTPHPQVGVPFHVTVTIRTRERITQPQYVYQPTFPGLEKVGDQRSLAYVNGSGSTFRETLTLVAHKPGPTAIGSAYMDAVDLNDSKTKRFFSNDLVLNVLGSAPPKALIAARSLLPLIVALLLLAAIAIAVLLFRRRRRPTIANAEPLPQPAAPVRPQLSLDEALAILRARRDRSSVLQLRETLWSMAGANQGETLGDVLQREPARTDGLRRILIAIERAAFIHDARLQQAIDAALSEREERTAR